MSDEQKRLATEWSGRLKVLRARLGAQRGRARDLTQHELAVELGVHDVAVSRWESKRHVPSEEHRRKLERLEAAGTKGDG